MRCAVTALVRNPSRLQVNHPRLTVIQGDVLDEGSVDAAMRGQEAVLSALGHKRFFYPTRREEIQRVECQGCRNRRRLGQDMNLFANDSEPKP